MRVYPTDIPDMAVIEPRVFEDDRGLFVETFQQTRYREAGLDCEFVQDNRSRSRRRTLRGLHYQIQHPQGKLVCVVRGEIYDVVVELRRQSPAFGRWVGLRLGDANHRQVFVPPGTAHGFCVLSETADVVYKCTDYYHPEHERTILWSDPQLAIDWPIRDVIVSDKDKRGLPFAEAPCFEALYRQQSGPAAAATTAE